LFVGRCLDCFVAVHTEAKSIRQLNRARWESADELAAFLALPVSQFAAILVAPDLARLTLDVDVIARIAPDTHSANSAGHTCFKCRSIALFCFICSRRSRTFIQTNATTNGIDPAQKIMYFIGLPWLS
jgi:hypothetical protein